MIGGSMALALKEKKIAEKIIGVDANPEHQRKALQLGLADEMTGLEEAVKAADLVILATPVNALVQILPSVLDNITRQVVMDVGSTKSAMLGAIRHHPKRGRFVATHPMWGTEYSGPEAAVREAFAGKATVICDRDDSDKD